MVESAQSCLRRVRGAFGFNEDRMVDIQTSSGSRRVIVFFVHENEEGIAESENLLTCASEGTGGLRLANAGDLDIHVQAGKIDSLGGIASWKIISFQERCLELLVEAGANRFPIVHSKQRSLSMR